MAASIQETLQQLNDARYNMFLTTANISLLDSLYKVELSNGMDFAYTTTSDGAKIYTPPKVYAYIDNAYQEITIAENNDIETLAYDCLPSRLDEGDSSKPYYEIIRRQKTVI
jgi:hypothetical protein